MTRAQPLEHPAKEIQDPRVRIKVQSVASPLIRLHIDKLHTILRHAAEKATKDETYLTNPHTQGTQWLNETQVMGLISV